MVRSIIFILLFFFIGCSSIQTSRNLRYSSRPVIEQSCLDLRQMINTWLGTQYLYGGNSRNGIDCSAFVQQIYLQVYQINLPRTTAELFDNGQRVRDN